VRVLENVVAVWHFTENFFGRVTETVQEPEKAQRLTLEAVIRELVKTRQSEKNKSVL
jgi:hypothetical protein